MLHVSETLFALLDDQSAEGIRAAVQGAIRLEHATMPPYLYAYYSLGNKNPAASRRLRRVFREEMLHMLLACNVLNAIGGKPEIDTPDFLVNYPDHLPGLTNNSLVVPLRQFSRDLVENVFMVIEEPENPLKFATAFADAPRTIGQFYSKLIASIAARGPSLFTGAPARQATSDRFTLGEPDQRVTDVTSATKALEYIVRQGEGTGQSPDATDGKRAHYYLFAELAMGKELVPNPAAGPDAPPDQRFIYAGPDVTVTDGDVIRLPDSPKAGNYPKDARAAAEDFNRKYTALLGQLQRTFDGEPAQLEASVDFMRNDLTSAARTVMEIELPDGGFAGPTFEYLQ